MNQKQRDKLARVLINEAFTCADRGDTDDARDLLKQSVKVRFHDEIEKIIDGDVALLEMFTRMQMDECQDKRGIGRAMIHSLIENERFLKKYKPVFTEIIEEEEES
tara:strand:+ start:210 stop:527 length:318 start_codon:yes stop_codon:yes gene_type:complete